MFAKPQQALGFVWMEFVCAKMENSQLSDGD